MPEEQEGKTPSPKQVADVGVPYPEPMRTLAEDLPERDEVEKAYKEGFLADSAQAEAKAKVKAVDASPDAAETPSGHALKKVAGIADDTKRGEEYQKHRAARRHGYASPEEE